MSSIACKIIWAFLVHNFEHHTQFLYVYLVCRQSAATVVSGTFVRNYVIAWYLVLIYCNVFKLLKYSQQLVVWGISPNRATVFKDRLHECIEKFSAVEIEV